MRVDNQKETVLRERTKKQEPAKMVQRKLNYDQEYLKQVPIREVMDILGIETDGRGKFCCPCHLKYVGKIDEHASGSVDEKKNRWKCFSCPGGGSTIDLVMEAKDLSFSDAVKFLVKYYPEADKSENVETNALRPIYQSDFYRSIGFDKNPYNVGAQMAYYVDEKKAMKHTAQERRRMGSELYKRESMPVEEWVITSMVIDKIVEKQEGYYHFANKKKTEYGLKAVDKALEENPDLNVEELRKVYDEAAENCIEAKEAMKQFLFLRNVKQQFVEYYDALESTVDRDDLDVYLENDEPEEEMEKDPEPEP